MKTMDVFILKSYSLRKTLIEMKKKQTFAPKVRYNIHRFFILIIKGASNDTT